MDALERGARRLCTEVLRLIESGLLDARSPAGDALLDLRDTIDPSWHPTGGLPRPNYIVPATIPRDELLELRRIADLYRTEHEGPHRVPVTFLDRGDGPDTSSAAADKVIEREGGNHVIRPGTHKAELLAIFGRAGKPITDTEAAELANRPRNEVAKRCTDLRNGGWIERVGEKMGDHGTPVMTCDLTDKGYRRWQELDTHAPQGPRPEPPAPSLFD